MPRFTLGSMLSGLVIALVAVLLIDRRPILGPPAMIRSAMVTPPDQGPQALAVDPQRGSIALGQEKANDYNLEDGFDWTGGLDEATW